RPGPAAARSVLADPAAAPAAPAAHGGSSDGRGGPPGGGTRHCTRDHATQGDKAMTAELVRGQNHPLSQSRLEIRISAGTPIVAAAALGDEDGRIRGTGWVAHPGAPTQPGLEVSRQAAADHRLAVDLDAVTDAVHRVSVLIALPAPAGAPGPSRFGAAAAPF